MLFQKKRTRGPINQQKIEDLYIKVLFGNNSNNNNNNNNNNTVLG